MAIIVDKNEKRKSIALSCKNLIINEYIKDITIAKLAKEAKIAKGSFYDYFKNKEDLVFAIVTIMMEEYNQNTQKKLLKAKNIKERLKLFSEFFYSSQDKDLRKIYKEFVAISLTTSNEQIITFQTNCYNIYYQWLKQIINDAIKDGELKSETIYLVDGLFATVKGLYISSHTTNALPNLKEAIDNYIDTIYNLARV